MSVMKSMKNNSVDMTFTDIPYAEVNRNDNGLRKISKDKADILTFKLNDFLSETYRITRGIVIIFCGREQFSSIYSFFSNNGGTARPIIWEKTNPSPMNGQHVYLSGVELAVWYKKHNEGHFNAYCKNTVFHYPNGRHKYHPTEKNIKLITELLRDNSNENDIIFDPCAGSATIGIACLQNNRNYIGIEIDENYFSIAEDRLKQAEANNNFLS